MVNKKDVLYGQNWCEQLMAARRMVGLVPIERSAWGTAIGLLAETRMNVMSHDALWILYRRRGDNIGTNDTPILIR